MAITASIAARSKTEQRSTSLDMAEIGMDYDNLYHQMIFMSTMTRPSLRPGATTNMGAT